jgi:hypothetical protein
MNSKRSISSRRATCLFLSAVILLLGIVQWSFLPILIQNGPVVSKVALEMSAGHTSKFAAPFKCLFGDELTPCPGQTRITVRRIASRIVRLPEAPISGQDDFSLSHRPLRAPPSA